MHSKQKQQYERTEQKKSVGYNKFMTQKEKDFVAYLFERANKKKEQSSPDFYTQDKVAMPETVKKEGGAQEQKRIFEGALGKATRKSNKKIAINTEEESTNVIVKKKVQSRGKIEEIYDILIRKEMCSTTEAEDDTKETKEVCEKLAEMGEDVYNIEKGILMIRKLLASGSTQKGSVEEYSRMACKILIDRLRYIVVSSEFCKLLSDIIPILTEYSRAGMKKDAKYMADVFLYNNAGAIVGNIVLLILKKEDEKMYKDVCRNIAGLLDGERVKKVFAKISHNLIWKLLCTVVRGVSDTDAISMKKKLGVEISSGLRGRTAAVIESIRVFVKKCPSE